MTISLATDYETAYHEQNQYFSYRYVAAKVDPLIMLTAFPQTQTHFFWQTPDQQLTLVGIDQVVRLELVSDASLVQQKAQLARRLFDPTESSRLFGAFPFDTQGAAAPLWEELGKGGFILPRYLFVFSKTDCYVTITVERPATFAELATVFTAEQAKIDQVFAKLASQQLPAVSNQVVTEEELAVEEWVETVNEAVRTIQNTTTSLTKVVLARQLLLTMAQPITAVVVLQQLQQQQPNTYLFLWSYQGSTFVGATPERLLAADDTYLVTAAVAGSIARGHSPNEDDGLGKELLASPKNTQEHQIVVDRIVKELTPLSREKLLVSPRRLLKNRDIQHLFAEIRGKRMPQTALLSMIQQLHPTPALGGEPKREATQWIREHEPLGRGLYGAPIGWIGLAKDEGEFAVGIRSAVLRETQALLYAGCGIVADSHAEEERQETAIKFQPMKRGIIGDDPSKNYDGIRNGTT